MLARRIIFSRHADRFVLSKSVFNVDVVSGGYLALNIILYLNDRTVFIDQ